LFKGGAQDSLTVFACPAATASFSYTPLAPAACTAIPVRFCPWQDTEPPVSMNFEFTRWRSAILLVRASVNSGALLSGLTGNRPFLLGET
jgi:hypothetical protein